MVAPKKPLSDQAGMARAVDYLLREFRRPSDVISGAIAREDSDAFEGPIEVSYLVASIEERPEIRALADYVCDGFDDEAEIGAALEYAASLGVPTSVVLSSGTFYLGTQDHAVTLTVPANCHLRGVGSTVSLVTHYSDADYDLQIIYSADASFSDFSIIELDCGSS